MQFETHVPAVTQTRDIRSFIGCLDIILDEVSHESFLRIIAEVCDGKC